MYSSLIIQSSNFFLVFSFLIYNPFFLLIFLFEVSPLSLYVPPSSVVSFLLSLAKILLLLKVLTFRLPRGGWYSPPTVVCISHLLHMEENFDVLGSCLWSIWTHLKV